jgi:lipid-binding SYLF domain-containing protein
MKRITNIALAALATMTLAGVSSVSAQDRHSEGDRHGAADELDAEGLTARRQEIIAMSKSTIADMREDESFEALLDDAYGHAVFDTTKGGFIVTGAGGTGVAMRKSGGDPVYMHMGAGGVGLGAGLENYKLVVLFENEEVYKDFIDGAWTAGASAQAAAGRDGAAVVGKFVNGVAVYHLTDKGVIAQADVTGVKFWPSDRLNPGVA